MGNVHSRKFLSRPRMSFMSCSDNLKSNTCSQYRCSRQSQVREHFVEHVLPAKCRARPLGDTKRRANGACGPRVFPRALAFPHACGPRALACRWMSRGRLGAPGKSSGGTALTPWEYGTPWDGEGVQQSFPTAQKKTKPKNICASHPTS